jgi:putative hydrolase of the HAD superfamily
MARHVIFDFFGTLVTYRDGVHGNPVERARAELQRHGVIVEPAVFAGSFAACFAKLEQRAATSLQEYSMLDVASVLFVDLGVTASKSALQRFVDVYLEDWTEGVEGLPLLAAWLDALAAPKSVLSNTHHEAMVVGQLQRLGIAPAFERLTTSVGHGMRKPHPSIYRAHLDALGISAADAVFVGDNPACDYFGPRAVGIDAYLIAPAPVAGVAERHRLVHLYQLNERLNG